MKNAAPMSAEGRAVKKEWKIAALRRAKRESLIATIVGSGEKNARSVAVLKAWKKEASGVAAISRSDIATRILITESEDSAESGEDGDTKG